LLVPIVVYVAGPASGQPSAIGVEIAPSGTLRAALIGSDSVLVTRRADGTLGGVSVALARSIAESLGVSFEPVMYPDTASYAKSFGTGQWDIAIGARLVRISGGSEAMIEALRTGRADVYGSNAENVHRVAAGLPGAKIVPGAFRSIRMAVAYPKARSAAAKSTIAGIVDAARARGLIQKSIEAARRKGVGIAP
jgi:ABC-type amino acid transport substrate-binding protein